MVVIDGVEVSGNVSRKEIAMAFIHWNMFKIGFISGWLFVIAYVVYIYIIGG